MMSEPVVLQQYQALTALGRLETTVEGLLAGRSGIREGPCYGVPVKWAPFPDKSRRTLDTCAEHLLAAVDTSVLEPRKTLFIFCAAKGDLRGLDSPEALQSGEAPPALLATQATKVRGMLGLDFGRSLVVSNACASGTIALEVASELLCERTFDHAVLFGCDPVSRFVATGFMALGALSAGVAKPFDKARDGLTLGDGAVVAIVSRRDPQPGDIVVAGLGSSNDANHRTGPSRTGEGLHRAAAAAVADAGMDPAELGAVKCHGTATVYNDAMEAKAIHRLFGGNMPPCASLKGALGHSSGAGSLVEVLIAAECLKRRVLPPTAGYADHGVDEPVPIAGTTQTIERPAVLCLSAGFGGVNAAAVVKEWLA
jgi:3-oxoacyl-[acyl-carrier-protein] synthase-1